MGKKRSKLFEECVIKSWWTILFFLICLFAYDGAMTRKKKEELKLRSRLQQIIHEKNLALAQQEDLKLKILSEKDEAWIELVLMQKLGLVPEGQIKIHFVPKKKDEMVQ